MITTLFVIFAVFLSNIAHTAESKKCPQDFDAAFSEAQAEGINIALLTKIGKENKK
jgi:hypothetical protein